MCIWNKPSIDWLYNGKSLWSKNWFLCQFLWSITNQTDSIKLPFQKEHKNIRFKSIFNKFFSTPFSTVLLSSLHPTKTISGVWKRHWMYPVFRRAKMIHFHRINSNLRTFTIYTRISPKELKWRKFLKNCKCWVTPVMELRKQSNQFYTYELGI